jgi:acyl carrier protein
MPPKRDAAEVEKVVTLIVARLAADLGRDATEIGPDTSLIDDVGLDSLKFVDLTMAIEELLEMGVFPMQEWVDAEQDRMAPHRFTIRSLSAACLRALDEATC